VESFNGKFMDELLNGEIFDTLLEARTVIRAWRLEYIISIGRTVRWDIALQPPDPPSKK
jgi:hypothetical protein